jgi:hypothetical protein
MFNDTTSNLAVTLDAITGLIAANPNHTGKQFWDRQSVTGVSLLQLFGKFRTLLQEVAPEKVSEAVAAAGSTLTPNQDGSVSCPE